MIQPNVHDTDSVAAKLPPCLDKAPLAVAWEITRAALHCDVDLEKLDLSYKTEWNKQDALRSALFRHKLFQGKVLPERCREDAWNASMSTFQTRGLGVALTADLEFVAASKEYGPLFSLSLQPLKLEQCHRLSRRFGADRFLEVNFPSPTGKDVPAVVRKEEGGHGPEKIIEWLTHSKHQFLRRQWAPFFTRDTKKKMAFQHRGRDTEFKMIHLERICFFAEDGDGFSRCKGSDGDHVPLLEEASTITKRSRFKLKRLLKWAIGADKSKSQPALKLFSRIALSEFDSKHLFRFSLMGRSRLEPNPRHNCAPAWRI